MLPGNESFMRKCFTRLYSSTRSPATKLQVWVFAAKYRSRDEINDDRTGHMTTVAIDGDFLIVLTCNFHIT